MEKSPGRVTRNVTSKATKEKFCSMSIEEKRKLYKCLGNYLQLRDIPTWPEYVSKHPKILSRGKHKAERSAAGYEVNKDINKRVSIWQGDITCLEIDAIVNAANSGLMGGGGVDGAIHSAAGYHLMQQECQELHGCDTGNAVTTLGYKLPAKYVIHTVGPRGHHESKLRSCYQKSFHRMQEKNLKSIAFPCVSTGIYGYPNEAAAPVAIEEARKLLQSEYGQKVERIIFCLFMPVDVKLYEEYMQIYFPVDPESILTSGERSTKSLGEDHKSSHLEGATANSDETMLTPSSGNSNTNNANAEDAVLNLPEVPNNELSSDDSDQGTSHQTSGDVDQGTSHQTSGDVDQGTSHQTSGVSDQGTSRHTSDDVDQGTSQPKLDINAGNVTSTI